MTHSGITCIILTVSPVHQLSQRRRVWSWQQFALCDPDGPEYPIVQLEWPQRGLNRNARL